MKKWIETIPLLETKRLWLREVNPEIYKSLFQHLNDPELMRFFGFTEPQQLELEKEKYRQGMTTWSISFKTWRLVDKETEIVIGRCGFHTWHIHHFRAEIGYVITEEAFKGKGLMTEAIAKIIEYGFYEMGLNRIEALIGPDNRPSLRLVEKFGFTREGQLREHYYKENHIEDSVAFSLLRSEYTK